MTTLERTNLLIIDDWGPEPLNAEQRRDLLEIVDDRYDRGSLLITSQIPVTSWHDVIGDPTLGDAILDRVLHTAHRIELKGEQPAPKGAKGAGMTPRALDRPRCPQAPPTRGGATPHDGLRRGARGPPVDSRDDHPAAASGLDRSIPSTENRQRPNRQPACHGDLAMPRMITVTGLDHFLQPESAITITGMRSDVDPEGRAAPLAPTAICGAGGTSLCDMVLYMIMKSVFCSAARRTNVAMSARGSGPRR